uniref:helix-turn-helix domain-containing protein n=1 Tax=Streptomyces spinoverrucosus TaxID=284043 RepID=UPI0027DA5977|nr:helix-turn-helix domain-containing protein [Streptomyces spinoverrucosus]
MADPWYDFIACVSENTSSCEACRIDRLCTLDQLTEAHTVVVPGWPDVRQAPPGELVSAIRDAHQAGARIVAAYTGAFVVAAAGLLDGRRATTHWAHAAALAAQFPQVKVDVDALYVDEGDILTSAGGAASLDLFLHVVELDHGPAVAKALAHRLVMPSHGGGEPAHAPAPQESGGEDRVLVELLSWVTERLDSQVTVEDMAQQANVSRRTLTRHFRASTGMAPLQWLLTQRVRLAQRLLETTHLSVEQIAAQTGMGTAATLRRHFGRTVGVPPDSYRRWYRGRSEDGRGIGLVGAPVTPGRRPAVTGADSAAC